MERMMQDDFVWQVHSMSNICERDPAAVQEGIADVTYFDENTSETLDPRLVQAG